MPTYALIFAHGKDNDFKRRDEALAELRAERVQSAASPFAKVEQAGARLNAETAAQGQTERQSSALKA